MSQLNFKRRMSNQDTYHALNDRIPLSALITGISLLIAFIGLVPFMYWILK